MGQVKATGMDTLQNIINTVGLDGSFFYQLFLAVGLYFVSKKLFFQPYLKTLNQRGALTRGRLKHSEELSIQIKKNKRLYEQKAKELNKKFQTIFNEIKKRAQENYLSETLIIEQEQKEWIKKQRRNLSQACKEQEKSMEQNLPRLVKLLVEKIRS